MSTWVHYQLEELMGDGSWQPVLETKEQAEYETPDYLGFVTYDQACDYARKHWRNPAHVQIVEVRTTRVILGMVK